MCAPPPPPPVLQQRVQLGGTLVHYRRWWSSDGCSGPAGGASGAASGFSLIKAQNFRAASWPPARPARSLGARTGTGPL